MFGRRNCPFPRNLWSRKTFGLPNYSGSIKVVSGPDSKINVFPPSGSFGQHDYYYCLDPAQAAAIRSLSAGSHSTLLHGTQRPKSAIINVPYLVITGLISLVRRRSSTLRSVPTCCYWFLTRGSSKNGRQTTAVREVSANKEKDPAISTL